MDTTMKITIRMPYLKWRDGRPRWEPNAVLGKEGWTGKDLKHPDGNWFTVEECATWITARMGEVKQRRAALAEASARGRRRPAMGQPRHALTLSGLSDRWIRHLDDTLKQETSAGVTLSLKPKTIRDYTMKAKWLLAFDPEIAETPVSALSRMICADLYQRMRLAAGDHMSAAVIRVASVMFSWGSLAGLCDQDKHPWRALRMKTPEPRQRAASVQEIRHLVAAADAIGLPEIGDSIMLGVWTGQRQGDRLTLQETSIGGNGGGRILFRQAKTGARVSIPQSAELLERLTQARERRRTRGVMSLFIVIDETTGKPFEEHRYRKQYAKVRAAAAIGIPDKLATMPSLANFRDQDLRDTSVTWLALARCNTEEIRGITGHDRETILSILKHYIAHHDGFADAAIDKLEAWYAKETG